MLKIARVSSQGPVSMSIIAREIGVSKSYLEQLAMPLRAAGLLQGRPGRAGGYQLSRPAADIKVREVVEAVIGPLDAVECVGDPSQCGRSHECQTRLVWALITSRVQAVLEDYSLEQLTDPVFMEDLRKQSGTEPSKCHPKVPFTCGLVGSPRRRH